MIPLSSGLHHPNLDQTPIAKEPQSKDEQTMSGLSNALFLELSMHRYVSCESKGERFEQFEIMIL